MVAPPSPPAESTEPAEQGARAASGALPAPGDLLGGRYRIGASLGRGAMGAVFEARHETLGTPHAIKVLAPSGPVDEAARRRFEREARIAATLKSPHLVAVTDVERDASGLTWFVMERLEGEDLGRRLEASGTLDVATSVRIARDVARGLEPVHAAGVVHRDLKPSNVFLEPPRAPGEPEHVRVLDFGVAALRDEGADRTTTGAVVGTPRTMAPEQLLGERADARADVWAVGVVLYRMLAGRWPYEGATPAAIMMAVVAGRPSLAEARPGLPPALVALVDRALEQALPARLASARELAEGLDAVLAELAAPGDAPTLREAAVAGDAVASRDAVVAHPAPLVPRRRGAPVALLGAALVAVAVVVVVRLSGVPADSHVESPVTVPTPSAVPLPPPPRPGTEPASGAAEPPSATASPAPASPAVAPPASGPSGGTRRTLRPVASPEASPPPAPSLASPPPPLAPPVASPSVAPPAPSASARGDGFPAHL